MEQLNQLLKQLQENPTLSPSQDSAEITTLTPAGIFKILKTFLGDSAHCIDPALSLKASPLVGGGGATQGAAVFQHLQAIRQSCLTPAKTIEFKKPIVMILAEPTAIPAKEEKKSGSVAQGIAAKISWKTVVLLPPNYKTLQGKLLKNSQPHFYYFDAQQPKTDTLPSSVVALGASASQGCQVPAIVQGRQAFIRMEPMLPTPRYFNACRSVAKNTDETCWWALSFAIMAVATGDHNLDEYYKPENLSVSRLRKLLTVESQPSNMSSSSLSSSTPSLQTHSSSSLSSAILPMNSSLSSATLPISSSLSSSSSSTSSLSAISLTPSEKKEEKQQEPKEAAGTVTKEAGAETQDYTLEKQIAVLHAYRIPFAPAATLSKDASGKIEVYVHQGEWHENVFLEDLAAYWLAKKGQIYAPRRVAFLPTNMGLQTPIAVLIQYIPDHAAIQKAMPFSTYPKESTPKTLAENKNWAAQAKSWQSNLGITILGLDKDHRDTTTVLQKITPISKVFSKKNLQLQFKPITHPTAHNIILTQDILTMLSLGTTKEENIESIRKQHNEELSAHLSRARNTTSSNSATSSLSSTAPLSQSQSNSSLSSATLSISSSLSSSSSSVSSLSVSSLAAPEKKEEPQKELKESATKEAPKKNIQTAQSSAMLPKTSLLPSAKPEKKVLLDKNYKFILEEFPQYLAHIFISRQLIAASVRPPITSSLSSSTASSTIARTEENRSTDASPMAHALELYKHLKDADYFTPEKESLYVELCQPPHTQHSSYADALYEACKEFCEKRRISTINLNPQEIRRLLFRKPLTEFQQILLVLSPLDVDSLPEKSDLLSAFFESYFASITSEIVGKIDPPITKEECTTFFAKLANLMVLKNVASINLSEAQEYLEISSQKLEMLIQHTDLLEPVEHQLSLSFSSVTPSQQLLTVKNQQSNVAQHTTNSSLSSATLSISSSLSSSSSSTGSLLVESPTIPFLKTEKIIQATPQKEESKKVEAESKEEPEKNKQLPELPIATESSKAPTVYSSVFAAASASSAPPTSFASSVSSVFPVLPKDPAEGIGTQDVLSTPISPKKQENKKPSSPSTANMATPPNFKDYTPEVQTAVLRAHAIPFAPESKLPKDASSNFEVYAYQGEWHENILLEDLAAYWLAKKGQIHSPRRVAFLTNMGLQTPLAVLIQYTPNAEALQKATPFSTYPKESTPKSLAEEKNWQTQAKSWHSNLQITILGMDKDDPNAKIIMEKIKPAISKILSKGNIQLQYKPIPHPTARNMVLTQETLTMLSRGATREESIESIYTQHLNACNNALSTKLSQFALENPNLAKDIAEDLQRIAKLGLLIAQRKKNHGLSLDAPKAHEVLQARDEQVKVLIYAQSSLSPAAAFQHFNREEIASLLNTNVLAWSGLLTAKKQQLRLELLNWEIALQKDIQTENQKKSRCEYWTEKAKATALIVYSSSWVGLYKEIVEGLSKLLLSDKEPSTETQALTEAVAKGAQTAVTRITHSPEWGEKTGVWVNGFFKEYPISRTLGLIGAGIGLSVQASAGWMEVARFAVIVQGTYLINRAIAKRQIREEKADIQPAPVSPQTILRSLQLSCSILAGYQQGYAYPILFAAGGVVGSSVCTAGAKLAFPTLSDQTSTDRTGKTGKNELHPLEKDERQALLFLIAILGYQLGQAGSGVLYGIWDSVQTRLVQREMAGNLLRQLTEERGAIQNLRVEGPSFRYSPRLWWNNRNPVQVHWQTLEGRERSVACEITALPTLTPQGLSGMKCEDLPVEPSTFLQIEAPAPAAGNRMG